MGLHDMTHLNIVNNHKMPEDVEYNSSENLNLQSRKSKNKKWKCFLFFNALLIQLNQKDILLIFFRSYVWV